MYRFTSSIFTAVSTVVASAAAAVVGTPAPENPIYARFRARGEEACLDQDNIMRSWWVTPPEDPLVRQTLTDLLAHSMTDPLGSLEHKLLCALWISKFDVNTGHVLRVLPVLNLLTSDHLDPQSHQLFSVFVHELTQDQWESIRSRMLLLIKGKTLASTDEKKQALLILAIGFPRFDERKQNEIIENLIIVMKSVDGQLPEVAVQALGNLKTFNSHQRVHIINEFLRHFGHTDEQFRANLGEALGKLFANSWDPEQEEIIKECTKKKDSANCHVRQTAYQALGALVSRANEDQRKGIVAAAVLGIKKELNFTKDTPRAADSAIFASVKCFPYAENNDRSFISHTLIELLNSNIHLEHKHNAVHALKSIYPHAKSETKLQIQQALVYALIVHPSVEIDAAQAIHDLAFDIETDARAKVNRVLGKAASNHRQSHIPTTDYLQAMPRATAEDLKEYLHPVVSNKVHDCAIKFCADTFSAKIAHEAKQDKGARASGKRSDL